MPTTAPFVDGSGASATGHPLTRTILPNPGPTHATRSAVDRTSGHAGEKRAVRDGVPEYRSDMPLHGEESEYTRVLEDVRDLVAHAIGAGNSAESVREFWREQIDRYVEDAAASDRM